MRDKGTWRAMEELYEQGLVKAEMPPVLVRTACPGDGAGQRGGRRVGRRGCSDMFREDQVHSWKQLNSITLSEQQNCSGLWESQQIGKNT